MKAIVLIVLWLATLSGLMAGEAVAVTPLPVALARWVEGVKSANSEGVARQILAFVDGKMVSAENADGLLALLRDQTRVLVKVEPDANVEVRDVILVALGEARGKRFEAPEQGKSMPLKAIVAWNNKAEALVYRYDIPRLSDAEYATVIEKANQWIGGQVSR